MDDLLQFAKVILLIVLLYDVIILFRKPEPGSKIITLDFEGSMNNGIREIGAILSNGTKITNHFDYNVKNEIECRNKLQNILSNNIDFIVSHNIPTEKNLLKKAKLDMLVYQMKLHGE